MPLRCFRSPASPRFYFFCRYAPILNFILCLAFLEWFCQKMGPSCWNRLILRVAITLFVFCFSPAFIAETTHRGNRFNLLAVLNSRPFQLSEPLALIPVSAPSSAPAPSPDPKQKAKASPKRRTHVSASLKSNSSTGNQAGRTAGIALIAVAGLLQVAIILFLLAKRRQMWKVVRTYQYEPSSENWNTST